MSSSAEMTTIQPTIGDFVEQARKSAERAYLEWAITQTTGVDAMARMAGVGVRHVRRLLATHGLKHPKTRSLAEINAERHQKALEARQAANKQAAEARLHGCAERLAAALTAPIAEAYREIARDPDAVKALVAAAESGLAAALSSPLPTPAEGG